MKEKTVFKQATGLDIELPVNVCHQQADVTLLERQKAQTCTSLLDTNKATL